jgi:hypothetical protein
MKRIQNIGFPTPLFPTKQLICGENSNFFSEWFLKLYRESFLIIIRQKYSIISKNKKGSAEQVSTPNEK